MALTHKLLKKTGTHTERTIEYGTEYSFLYESGYHFEWDYYGSSYDASRRWLLRSDSQYYPGASDPRTTNHYSLTAGTYEVSVEGENAKLTLMMVASFVPNERATKIGEFSDGDIVTLTEDAIYLLAVPDSTDRGYKLTACTVNDVEVDDYSTTVIEEPIGWDDLQMTIKRNDYHGMGAEVSLGELEFYGAAFDLIKSSYEENIDQKVLYQIENDGTAFYSGGVDLTTCSFIKGDYQSVKAKIGDIGPMTTFNNRVKTDIDLNSPKTVDGLAVATPTWQSIHIPVKHLLYTNFAKTKADTQVPQSGVLAFDGENRYLVVPIGDFSVNEFGSVDSSTAYVVGSADSVESQYIASTDHTQKYGNGTMMDVDISLSVTLNLSAAPGSSYTFYRRLVAKDNSGNTIQTGLVSLSAVGSELNIYARLQGELSAGDGVRFYLIVYSMLGSVYTSFNASVVVKKGSYVSMKMYDTLEDDEVNTKMIFLHDAFNVVAKSISENELTVKSEWCRLQESYINPGELGGGSLKALSDGYHIRGLFTNGELERNMPVSFKGLIEALDALDCIGWGFSTEDGQLYVRVERWDWFYKDTTILTLTNVAEVTTAVFTDRIPTELQIGYKKYATQDQYNSIDSPHGSRTFTNGIKALSKALTKECEFIADNYAIEETRRARTQVNETEETTYDESIFVFELVRVTDNGTTTFAIGHTATNAENVGRTNEFINAKLTPRHMAARWRDYLFATNNTTPFRFTSGEINYKSKFGVIPAEDEDGTTVTESLATYAENSPQTENDDITYSHAKFKAEKITFSYPLTVSQYNAVKANPYGLVSVNGVLGWILDFKYKFEDGMADFTLIAKNTN